ncbi:phosphonate metabolism protein PhnP [Synechococcus sp. PCC 6716]|nr:phosphonate metabolism protein PhnP [Synechococcus sp. PCC 6716]
MRLTLLGTGDAGGVPCYGCNCVVCNRARQNPTYRRRPCSALLNWGAESWLIDGGLMDLGDRFPPGTLSGILLTHFHVDHVQGLFHLRWGMGAPITVYCPPDPQGCADLYRNPGLLRFQPLTAFTPISLGQGQVIPIPLQHSKLTFGYCMEDSSGKLAYLTDTVGLPPKTQRFLEHWQPDAVVIDCGHPPQPTQPRNHNDVPRALAILDALQPRQGYLTHMGHECDRWLMVQADFLPATVRCAQDGDIIVLQ